MSGGDLYVYHFVLRHGDRDLDRLATLCVEPAERFRLGPTALAKAIDGERLRYQRAVLKQYGPGWSVRVVEERGYVRSMFPGAAVPDAPLVAARAVPGHEGVQ